MFLRPPGLSIWMWRESVSRASLSCTGLKRQWENACQGRACSLPGSGDTPNTSTEDITPALWSFPR
jgi:hypothetical protein